MPDRLEMAPVDNRPNETDRLTNDDFDGVDDGLHPRRQPPNNAVDGTQPLGPPVYSKPVQPTLDVNKYATKKTVAQGMMDLALLTANANQLRYVLESGSSGPFFIFSVVLISMSIILQLVTGVVLILVGRYNLIDAEEARKSDRLNNWVIATVFLITAINVLISAFGIDPVERMDPVLIVDAALQSLRAERLETTTNTLFEPKLPPVLSAIIAP